MKLYLITQTERRGYDTYDSVVVAANTPEEAKTIYPRDAWPVDFDWNEWASKPENVTATYIGTAKANTPKGVILASYNAG